MRIAAIAAFGSTLVACGGGGGSGSTAGAVSSTPAVTSPAAAAPQATNTTQNTLLADPLSSAGASVPGAAPAAVPSAGNAQATVPASTAATTTSYTVYGIVTDIRIQNTTASPQTNLPVTFGQVFAAGHFMPGDSLVGRFDNGTDIALQIDVKATHPDGSVRHAVVSGMIPSLNASETRVLSLMKTNAPRAAGLGPKTLLLNGFSASVHATIGGVRYKASADDIIKTGGAYQTWLSGAIANEWQVSAPLTSDDGVAHPHLTARFAIRWYDAIKKARVDVTVENAWAYEPNPQNVTYDAEVRVRGAVVYSKPGLTHFHHSRWRKMFWWGGDASQAFVQHNTAYLLATRALPNYDLNAKQSESGLAALASRYAASSPEPMKIGLALAYMPEVGGRDDIGLLPAWAASYLLSMDKRARDATLGTADLAGSWSAHYRDKATGRPVSLMNYPFMTILGRSTDTYNKLTQKFEAFPACNNCASPYTLDTPHQPAFAYLPYLVTGDYYYLEELQFWAMWNVFSSNPGYRKDIQGLLAPDQVRGQAWSLRTLAEAAYISPDNDVLKEDFNRILTNNLDWYAATYLNGGSGANTLGIITNGPAVVYNNNLGMAPWQDDFFTQALGHTAELGFTKALALLKWKATYPIERIVGSSACWVGATMYSMNVRASASGPLYATIGEAFAASNANYSKYVCGSPEMAAALNLQPGEMQGYAGSPLGYPSNLQPALAMAADVSGSRGAAAWATFAARRVKPDYSASPQFAIVPR